MVWEFAPSRVKIAVVGPIISKKARVFVVPRWPEFLGRHVEQTAIEERLVRGGHKVSHRLGSTSLRKILPLDIDFEG
jgi:hypothetical protein